jgi:beta-N-acetylglucosaminidase
LKDEHVKKNPSLGMYANNVQWAKDNKKKINEMYKLQSQTVKEDIANNKVLKAMHTVVSSILPKSLPM